MRKITFGCICSFAFLWVASVVTVLLRSLFSDVPKNKGLAFVIVALAVALVNGSVYLLLRKRAGKPFALKTVSFFINAIALGIAMTGWYVNRGYHNPLWMMTLICLCAVLSLIIMYGVLQIPIIAENAPNLTVLLLLLFSLCGYVLLVIFTKTTYLSTFGYYAIVTVAFFFSLVLPSEDENDVFSNIFIATYSIVAVAILMLIIIGGGDGFDLDIGCNGLKIEKKKHTQ